MKEEFGNIFNIQRFSVHDGPGIRTVVFLKGCPLRCRWCANPESQKSEVELAWTASKCIGCKKCENSNLSCRPRFEEERLKWGNLSETDIDPIEKICPSKALHTIGHKASVSEVINDIEKDQVFYGDEEGGLTLSGGEPLLQHKFALNLLRTAKDHGINTCIETTGYAPTDIFLQVASELDYLLMDIKTMRSDTHKAFTGVDNRLIIENFKAVREEFPLLPVHVRTPVIPGFNDDEDSIREIHDFLASYKNVRYELLKYHRLGVQKYESLGREYEMPEEELDIKIFEDLKRFEL